MRHFATAKLQLHAHFVAPVEKFLAVANLRQIIVIVDVDPKLDLLQPRTPGSAIPLVLGKIVTEFAEGDDFADRRVGRGRHFYEIEPATLRFTQGVGQLQDAKLLTGAGQNNSDFAGANPTVYTNLWLQIKSISWPAKRECAVSP